MKIRLTIGKKISSGFAVLIIFTIGAFILTNDTLKKSKRINDLIYNVYNPSVYLLEELSHELTTSQQLIGDWVNFQKSEDAKSKISLVSFIDIKLPDIESKVAKLSTFWIDEERKVSDTIFNKIDTLILQYNQVRELLNTWEAYDDVTNRFLANDILDNIQVDAAIIHKKLKGLRSRQKENANRVSQDMVKSFDQLIVLVKWLGIALVVGGLLIAFYTTNSIVRPISKLKFVLLDLSKGVFPKKKLKIANDEIGDMTDAMNKLVSGLDHTKEFANAIGSGNFSFPYTPLSDQDDLGKDLLKMRTDLAENERILEEKVRLRTAEVVKQKEEIEQQSQEISNLYSEVTDSIQYAKNIQQAILLPIAQVKKLLPSSFVFFEPKDIVSGDFYWFNEKNDKTYFAAVDCTGHGVPGAFMSILGYDGLEQALRLNDKPAGILNELNRVISDTFHVDEGKEKRKDGMDIALCSIDTKTRELTYAGAFNPLFVVRKGEMMITKADKFPIGSSFLTTGEQAGFTDHTFQLEKDDMIYVFTDGFQDQFGGEKGKKYMVKRFRELLTKMSELDADKQLQTLQNEFREWMGIEEQVDDVLIIGIRVT